MEKIVLVDVQNDKDLEIVNVRERIKERQAQGIAIAKTQGKYQGRKALFTEDDSRLKHAFELYLSGMSDKDVAGLTGINERTFRRYREKYQIKR